MRFVPCRIFVAVVVLPGLTGLLGLAGCGPAFVVTDSFTPPPEGPFASKRDQLHDYVVGTELRLDVRAARAFVDLDRVEVVSKSPELLEVLAQERVEDELRVRLRAVAEGTVGINFLDEEQRPIEERVVLVKVPDAILLDVNIDTDRGYTLPPIDGEDLHVAVGGAATFRVRYEAEGEEVKGKGVLVGAATTLTVENQTRESPDREFLTLHAPPEATEASPVELSVAGKVIRTLQVRNTPLEEIAAIQLDEGTLPMFRSNGDVFTVWAKAFTADAAPVFGAPLAWTFESTALEGDGDLLSYTFASGERRRVQVTAGDAVEDLTLEAKDGTAQIASTADPGCAAAPPAAPAALGLALAAFTSRRRRRRASSSSPLG